MTRRWWTGAVGAACAIVLAVPPAAADMLPCDPYEASCDNALPRTDLYDLRPTRPGPAGQLLGQEPVADYQLDVPVDATRIMYRSVGADGEAGVSAVVLVPAEPTPPGGWPVVAYAHGTSGSATLCAPSLMADLYHGSQLSALLRAGLAVVATDYAGLGGHGAHPAIAKDVLARNVIDSLAAARTAVPTLSEVWAAYGHSQGGLAVLGVAERLNRRPDAGYRGVVATAPPSQLPEWFRLASENPYAAGFVPLAAKGVKAQHPQLQMNKVLTPEAARRLPILDSGCLFRVQSQYFDLTGPALVTPTFLREPHLARALRAAEPGRRPVAGPILLLHGGADSQIPAHFSDRLATRLRHRHADLEYRVIPGLEHDTYPGGPQGIDDGAMPDIVQWLSERLAS